MQISPFPTLRCQVLAELVQLNGLNSINVYWLKKDTNRKSNKQISPALIPLSSSCFLAEALLGLPLPRLLWSEWLLDLDLFLFSKSLFTAEFIFSRLTLSVLLLLASLLFSVQMNRNGIIQGCSHLCSSFTLNADPTLSTFSFQVVRPVPLQNYCICMISCRNKGATSRRTLHFSIPRIKPLIPPKAFCSMRCLLVHKKLLPK